MILLRSEIESLDPLKGEGQWLALKFFLKGSCFFGKPIKMDMTIREFCKENLMSNRLRVFLWNLSLDIPAKEKLETVGQLLEKSGKELLEMRNFGKKSLEELARILAHYYNHTEIEQSRNLRKKIEKRRC